MKTRTLGGTVPPPIGRIAATAAYRKPTPRPFIDLRLDGNENLLCGGAETDGGSGSVARYPDATDLERLIARRAGVTADRVVVTAGADEALDRVCRTWLDPTRRAVLVTPAFEMTRRYVALAGADVEEVPWIDGELPIDELRSAARGEAVLFIASPANPTGLTASEESLVALAEACPESLFVIDLAYVEYAGADPTVALAALDNIVIIRSFSKAWGLAALRVGYAIAPEKAAGAMRAAGGPYSVAGPSLDEVTSRITDPNIDRALTIARDSVARSRTTLRLALESCGARVSDSEGNFVLARVPDARWFSACLSSLGIAVRSFDDPCLEDAVRITCPPEGAPLTRLVRAIKAALTPTALLLDMDGVIADVGRTYRRAVVDTARAFGVEVSDSEVAARKRKGRANDDWILTRDLIEAGGGPARLDDVRVRFQEILRPLMADEELIPSTRTLRLLATRTRLGIVTGRPRVEALAFLERFGIPACFEVVITREDAPSKPDPQPVWLALERLGVTRAWMVGDTVDDLAAARGAGVVPIGVVAPGGSDRDRGLDRDSLAAAGAARVLESLDELLELLP